MQLPGLIMRKMLAMTFGVGLRDQFARRCVGPPRLGSVTKLQQWVTVSVNDRPVDRIEITQKMPCIAQDRGRHAVVTQQASTRRVVLADRLTTTIMFGVIARSTAKCHPLDAPLGFALSLLMHRNRPQQWVMLGATMPATLVP
ncbi:hypothetical protein D3C81_1507470 [compost metagenome]